MSALIGTLAGIPVAFAIGWFGPRLLDRLFPPRY